MDTLDQTPIFGKNVIETLSEGMYDNPLFLFREYVQNSADAIDAAIDAKILKKGEAQININIDSEQRIITFEDNGTGIRENQVKSLLANIGDSQKDRTVNKGFRGIGRLGGLGYCKTVRFETSAYMEDRVTILEWNAEELHRILADKNEKIDAGELIKKITTVYNRQTGKHEHFFKVSLIGIKDTSDDLLDIEDVRRYLSMVAPVPFDYERFRFVDEIEKFVAENNLPKLHEYNVFLNGDEIRKGYETPLKIEDNQSIDILNVVCRLLKENNVIVGWYWFCVSKFEGVIPKKCWQRCIRLRKANIQIGEADCLSNHPKRGQALWKEDRGNNYFLGEIHAIDPDLIPNSRRDYFNQDSACRRFEKILAQEFKDLHELYHQASSIRSAKEQIVQAHTARKQYEEKIHSGVFLGAADKQKALQKVESAEEKAKEAQKKLEKLQEKINASSEEKVASAQVLNVYTQDLKEQISLPDMPNANSETGRHQTCEGIAKDKFAKVNKNVKRLLQEVFAVIEKMLPEEQAEPLKEAIIKRVSHL